MPIPIPVGDTPPPTSIIDTPGSPTLYVRQPQNWMHQQHQDQHEQALYLHGEYSVIFQWWTLRDFTRGLVVRCLTCMGNATAAAYGQSTDADCPSCFGTTYEGGWKNRLIRPTLWQATDEDQNKGARGTTLMDTGSVEVPGEIGLVKGDVLVRAEGSRWRSGTGEHTTLASGYGTQFNVGQVASVTKDNDSSVAFLLPPLGNVMPSMLANLHVGLALPANVKSFEIIRGPLT